MSSVFLVCCLSLCCVSLCGLCALCVSLLCACHVHVHIAAAVAVYVSSLVPLSRYPVPPCSLAVMCSVFRVSRLFGWEGFTSRGLCKMRMPPLIPASIFRSRIHVDRDHSNHYHCKKYKHKSQVKHKREGPHKADGHGHGRETGTGTN